MKNKQLSHRFKFILSQNLIKQYSRQLSTDKVDQNKFNEMKIYFNSELVDVKFKVDGISQSVLICPLLLLDDIALIKDADAFGILRFNDDI